jgi:hypothetical protein
MLYCDLNCRYASWPDALADGSGSCRTFVGLYCDKVKRMVHKNAPCVADLSPQEKIDAVKPISRAK